MGLFKIENNKVDGTVSDLFRVRLLLILIAKTKSAKMQLTRIVGLDWRVLELLKRSHSIFSLISRRTDLEPRRQLADLKSVKVFWHSGLEDEGEWVVEAQPVVSANSAKGAVTLQW